MIELIDRFAGSPGGAFLFGAMFLLFMVALSVKPEPELVASTATLDALAPPVHAGLVSVYSPEEVEK